MFRQHLPSFAYLRVGRLRDSTGTRRYPNDVILSAGYSPSSDHVRLLPPVHRHGVSCGPTDLPCSWKPHVTTAFTSTDARSSARNDVVHQSKRRTDDARAEGEERSASNHSHRRRASWLRRCCWLPRWHCWRRKPSSVTTSTSPPMDAPSRRWRSGQQSPAGWCARTRRCRP